jgi:hypothetical protein
MSVSRGEAHILRGYRVAAVSAIGAEELERYRARNAAALAAGRAMLGAAYELVELQ